MCIQPVDRGFEIFFRLKCRVVIGMITPLDEVGDLSLLTVSMERITSPSS
jgi:hypothetical protein